MATFLKFLLILHFLCVTGEFVDLEAVEMARQGILRAVSWAQRFDDQKRPAGDLGYDGGALEDCVTLYSTVEERLARLVSGGGDGEDAVAWLSSAMASHRACLDELGDSGSNSMIEAQNLTAVIRNALIAAKGITFPRGRIPDRSSGIGLLGSWNPATSPADIVVAQDGSGHYKTISDAVSALSPLGRNRPERAVVYVKSGVYREKVEIGRHLRNVMFVGDGIDKTIVTGNRNFVNGATTFNSATFGVAGDGFWARDMTFENTAGPAKHQAVAMRVSSDKSIFYRCSFKGFQDTLFVLSSRQFYRDCEIHGTVDFIFGDAAAIFQNCDIIVRRPMDHQANTITAQGRSDPNQNTGISVINSRVRAAVELRAVRGRNRIKSYLGRPWKKYSRTMFMKTAIDECIDGRGWSEWDGDFAISTLYYGEYMNFGPGANTANRVKWPGFHVLRDPGEADRFTVKNFISGDGWIPATGVPFSAGL